MLPALDFFVTLASIVGLGVMSKREERRDEAAAKANPIKPMKNFPFGNKEADKLFNWSSQHELMEIYKSEYGEDPPVIKVMMDKLGYVDWDRYEGYIADNVIRDCCVLGISEKRNYVFNNPGSCRCNFCDQYGIRCKWNNNRSLEKRIIDHRHNAAFID